MSPYRDLSQREKTLSDNFLIGDYVVILLKKVNTWQKYATAVEIEGRWRRRVETQCNALVM